MLNLNSGLVIAVKNASTANGASVVQYPYEPTVTANEIMVVESEPGNYNRIKPRHTYSSDGNPHNDKCLAVKNAVMNVDAEIVSATCTYDGQNNDVWQFVPTTIYPYQAVRNLKSGLCLVVKGASNAANAVLIQHRCNGTSNGYWSAD